MTDVAALPSTVSKTTVVALLKSVAIVTALLGAVLDVAAQPPAPSGNITRSGICEREAEKLVGQKAVKIGGSIGPPRKLFGPRPKYPELPPGTIASGMWVGEVLVDAAGRVREVWPLHEVKLKPAFPAFNQAVVEWIRRWRYEPLMVNGATTPFCMTFTTNLHFA